MAKRSGTISLRQNTRFYRKGSHHLSSKKYRDVIVQMQANTPRWLTPKIIFINVHIPRISLFCFMGFCLTSLSVCQQDPVSKPTPLCPSFFLSFSTQDGKILPLKIEILLKLFVSDVQRLFSYVIEATCNNRVLMRWIVFLNLSLRYKQSLGDITCEDDYISPCHNRKRFLSRSSLTVTRIYQEGNVPASAPPPPEIFH